MNIKSEKELLSAWKKQIDSQDGKLTPSYGLSKICQTCGRFFYSYHASSNACGTCVPNNRINGTNKFAA